MTLTEFLLARIAEDEAAAREAATLSEGGRWWVDPNAAISGKHWVYATGEKFTDRPVAEHIARHDPARVLRRCEADRKIVELRAAADVPAHLSSFVRGQDDGFRQGLDEAIRELAAAYADHPDYRGEWRP